MYCDFEIHEGIYLVKTPYELDLHNCFDFKELHYSVKDQALSLNWQRSEGEWVAPDTPKSVNLEFREVTEFRFLPRDVELPFTEDNCVNTFGYLTDEDLEGGVFLITRGQNPEPNWLTAIEFMSGAVIAVQAASAHAQVEL